MSYFYKGAVHIHTTASDGTGVLSEIVKSAKKNHLDFIIISDHNKMSVKEGIYDGVAVIVAEEISPKKNHYLAFNIKKEIEPSENPQEYIDEVNNQGGFGFLAHPDESISRKNQYPPLKWDNLDYSGISGIELWNYFSDWADNYDTKNIFTIAHAYIYRNQILKGASERLSDFWDKKNNEQEAVFPALGGVDAHALKIKKYIYPVTIFPYTDTFNTIINIINTENQLTQDFENKKNTILSALKRGQNLIINNYWGKICGDEIFIKNNSEKVFSGGEIKLDADTNLFIQMKKDLQISIFQNGEKVFEMQNCLVKFPVKKAGKYRVEIKYNNHPYIYTNPIIVK